MPDKQTIVASSVKMSLPNESNEEREIEWLSQLFDVLVHFKRYGARPSQRSELLGERTLGVWFANQVSSLRAGQLSEIRSAALEETGLLNI